MRRLLAAVAVALPLAFGPGAGAAQAPTLLDTALAETRAAIAEAEAAGYPLPCQPTVWVAPLRDGRSFANGDCQIVFDAGTIRGDQQWWRYVARHEVCHIATGLVPHHSPWFRACESDLARHVGYQLAYGDDPEGYPVAWLPVPGN